MPRPRPEEGLSPFTIRLTRKQFRKVQEMGGGKWVRSLISNAQATKHGRDPVQFLRDMKARNEHIATSGWSTEQLAFRYNLSVQRVRQIRKEHNEHQSSGQTDERPDSSAT